jgi:hypothetical protein
MPNLYNKEVVAELNPAMYANGMANKAAHANDIAYIVLTLFENIHPLPVSCAPPPPKSTSVSANETDFLPVVVAFVLYFSAMADFPPPDERTSSGGAFGFPNTFLLLVFLAVEELLFFVTIGLISLSATPRYLPKRVDDALPRIRLFDHHTRV